MNHVDYSKVDPWVKKNREGRYKEFKRDNPKVVISTWTFEKRRRHILGLKLSPSMSPGYRSPHTGATRSKNSCVYSTILSLPTSDLEGKSGVEVIQLFLDNLNASMKLGLEAVKMSLVGNGNTSMIEVRRYSK
jgi:hypothetical protein